MINFEVRKVYEDRVGNRYEYLYKNGNVTVFAVGDKKEARHASGRYRWDGANTDVDIVKPAPLSQT